MTWTAAVQPVIVAVLVVFLPGLAVAAALKLRGITALALAGPLAFGVLGLAGVVSAALHIPFGWWSVAGATFVAVVVLLAVRVLAAMLGAPLPAWDAWRARAVLPVLLAAAIASVAIATIAFAAVPSPDRVSQTYDAVFHLNAAESIVQTGDASSLHLYRLTHPTQSTAFYPAVWHSIVALTAGITHVPITVATNAVWIATAGPVFSLGCAFAAAVLFGGTAFRGEAPALQRTVVAAVAALLASAFVAFPYLLLDFGTLYPNGLAYTTLPVGLALVAAVLAWPAAAPWRPESPGARWRTGLLVVAWLGAAAFTHPRSAVALLALAAPLLVAWFAARMRALAIRGDKERRRARRYTLLLLAGIVLVIALAGLVVYTYYDVASRPIADHLNGPPARARESFGQALLQGLLATSLVSPAQSPLAPSVLLAAVALAGLVAMGLRPGLRWAVAGYLLIVLLYAFAAGSDSDLAKVATGLWDKDKFRILAMLPTIGVPVVAWTVTVGAFEAAAALRQGRAHDREPRPRALIAGAVVAALLVAVVTWVGPALGGVSSAIGVVFSLPRSDKGGLLLDEDQAVLLTEVGRFVPAGQTIVENPWNGSALAWALGGRQTLFPHLGGYWGKERKVVALHLDDYATDPRVCNAVRHLHLHWVLNDPQRLWNNRSEAKAFFGIDRAVKGKGVRLVASSGTAALYRLTACWP
ncbi:MAG: hypothetical protein QOE37_273 [Microbacteriaceae bacterium]|nr:hypothetical protein [Microbacteriaceae bacterium]